MKISKPIQTVILTVLGVAVGVGMIISGGFSAQGHIEEGNHIRLAGVIWALFFLYNGYLELRSSKKNHK